MNDISIGAVGAAAIAGIVSLLGLIIGKEQKVSEFRQAWIDELRKCFVGYVVSINSISDVVRLKRAGKSIEEGILVEKYKILNEANHGISLRVNGEEPQAQKLLLVMNEFEDLASDNARLTPENIKKIEEKFTGAARELLKYEWSRVKRGEEIFVWTKRVLIAGVICMGLLLCYAAFGGHRAPKNADVELHLVLNVSGHVVG